MATALLPLLTPLPSYFFVSTHHSPNLCFFSHRAQLSAYGTRGVSGRILAVSPSSLDPISDNTFWVQRRDLMLFGLSSSASLLFSFPASSAVAGTKGDLKVATLVDDINAYSFQYPMEVPSKKFVFKWVESRKPERYSSAAPLSPDARQRIVSERVDIIDNVVISVSIGPPNLSFLKSKDKSTWDAKDVADSVLSDKSALRIMSDQRLAESSVLDAHSSNVDGELYWYYEYLVRKSPTNSVQGSSNLYRHNVASTAERDGYLYSLNVSTLSNKWNFMGPVLEKTVASFRLLPPTEDYVPPYKDPWRFW